MQLQDLFTNLAHGELNNLLSDGGAAGALPWDMQRKVTVFLNQGLTKLSARFPLISKEVIIEAQDDVYLYYLRKEYALTDPTVMDVKYLRDTEADPFTGDVVYIQQIFTEYGIELPLNDPEQPDSFFTPRFDCVQIPTPVTGAAYAVIYQARHPKIDFEDLGAEILVPDSLQIALNSWICFQIFNGMNGPEHKSNAAGHLAAYENTCLEVEATDQLRSSQILSGQRFSMRGFR